MLILCLDIIYFPCQVQVPKHLKNIYLNQAKPIYWANSKHMKKVTTRQRFNLIIHYLPNLVAMVRHWSLITTNQGYNCALYKRAGVRHTFCKVVTGWRHGLRRTEAEVTTTCLRCQQPIIAETEEEIWCRKHGDGRSSIHCIDDDMTDGQFDRPE